jgi:hypothetical protein
MNTNKNCGDHLHRCCGKVWKNNKSRKSGRCLQEVRQIIEGPLTTKFCSSENEMETATAPTLSGSGGRKWQKKGPLEDQTVVLGREGEHGGSTRGNRGTDGNVGKGSRESKIYQERR